MKSRDEIISEYYDRYFGDLCNSGLQGKGSEKFHRLVEKYWLNKTPRHILEVGAGIGEHFQFVKLMASDRNQIYTALDIRDPGKMNFKFGRGTATIKWEIGSVQEMPFEDLAFDRVVSTCLFCEVFAEDEVALHYWPTHIPSWNLNLAVIAHIRK